MTKWLEGLIDAERVFKAELFRTKDKAAAHTSICQQHLIMINLNTYDLDGTCSMGPDFNPEYVAGWKSYCEYIMGGMAE